MWKFSLLVLLLSLSVACAAGTSAEEAPAVGDEAPADLVSLARIRQGEMIGGECRFSGDISQYPATYSPASDECFQAVRIGPIDPTELERMKRDVPLFWENSSPYRQVLIGKRIDVECDFTAPAVRAYLAVSEIVSTDQNSCRITVELGPVTEKQIEEIQSHGMTESSTAIPQPSEPVPDQ